MTAFTVIIPARYGSLRFPGKPLALLQDKPMVVHVIRRAEESGAQRVVVATDDSRIRDVCAAFGKEAVMTRADHRSGTDRLAEVVTRLQLDDAEIVVNVQGDEPLMPPEFISRVAGELRRHRDAGIATLVTPLRETELLADPNVVKVIRNRLGYALYFSRAPVPWDRESAGRPSGQLSECWRHLGIYAYRAAFLRGYPELESPLIEQRESLEQLRALWHGVPIVTAEVAGDAGPGVDTPADLARVEALLTRR